MIPLEVLFRKVYRPLFMFLSSVQPPAAPNLIYTPWRKAPLRESHLALCPTPYDRASQDLGNL